jgi:7-cyano-7-deazaguanine tRNA-ribosyltransferase
MKLDAQSRRILYKTITPLREIISVKDHALRRRLNRTLTSVPSAYKKSGRQKTLSLEYSPESFNVLRNGYKPPQDKRVLLIIPCSGGKPYSSSRSHRMISRTLSESLGDAATRIHKVTLSGLYGPVPEEFENESVVLNYDFRLEISNGPQVALVVNRITDYLERHKHEYDFYIAYATSRAYRTVLDLAAQQFGHLQVVPAKPKSRRMLEFFRTENLQELVKQCSSFL